MSKEIYISSTPHETRLAIVEKDELSEIYYERENEYTLAGSIYKGKVTRVLPGMQSSFVDIGLERDAFLYITDFMEEAGESADFDSGEGRGSRGGGRDRGDRGGRGRNGERRREGGRGEGRQEQGHDEQRPQSSSDDESFDSAPREAEGEDVGEGAPGADGSRRWRGRRGRRRGGRGGSEQSAGATPEISPASEDDFGGEREPREERSAREGEGRRERGEGEGRGRRDRGGRGRDDRGGREDRQRHDAIRERFAPRTSHHHGGDEGEGVDVSASAEPFILPGESLGKYRRNEEGAVEAAPAPRAAAPAAKPSTEFDFVVTGWDGGATLPGETLSRGRDRGNEAPREEGSRERSARDEGRGGSGRDRRRERDAKRGGDRERSGGRREFTPERELDPAEAVLPAVTSQHEPEETKLPLTDDAPEFETAETEQRLDAEHQQAEEVVYEPETDAAPAETAASRCSRLSRKCMRSSPSLKRR